MFMDEAAYLWWSWHAVMSLLPKEKMSKERKILIFSGKIDSQ
ncbi:hypothetical protein HMPREF3232_01440 [Fannyhessea vaginae]|nr:hypothetical protein HMPREF3232_01440 [Fannyhessea vaginae]